MTEIGHIITEIYAVPIGTLKLAMLEEFLIFCTNFPYSCHNMVEVALDIRKFEESLLLLVTPSRALPDRIFRVSFGLQ